MIDTLHSCLRHLLREWRFMLRQKYILVLLMCTLVVVGFSVISGLNEVSQQQQTIERLKQADSKDRNQVQSKYDDPGYLAYYSFHFVGSTSINGNTFSYGHIITNFNCCIFIVKL